jgi:hypothetical protein
LVQATPPAQPPAPVQTPIQAQPLAAAQPPAPAPPPAPEQPPAPALPTPPTAPPLPGPSGAQQPLHSHNLRPRQPQDYRELNSGIKQRCRKLRRQAKAVVTKLAPGAFSPKLPPDNQSPDHQTPRPLSLGVQSCGHASFNSHPQILLLQRNLSSLTPSSLSRTNFNSVSVQ